MVLPLVEEDWPKCYMCYERFADMEKLREHQRSAHKYDADDQENRREPAPGDVTMF